MQILFAQNTKSIDYIREILRSQKKTVQFYLQIDNTVYNPESKFPLYQDIGLQNLSEVLPNKFYSQKLLFIRDEFVGIETFDKNKNLIHLFLESTLPKKISFNSNLNYEKHFSKIDIYTPFIPFLVKSEEKFLLSLDYYRIDYTFNTIDIINNIPYIIIGNEKNNMHILKNELKISKINTNIQINNKEYLFTIIFSLWTKKEPFFPKKIHYYIENRLIKSSDIQLITHQNKKLISIRSEMIQNYNSHK